MYAKAAHRRNLHYNEELDLTKFIRWWQWKSTTEDLSSRRDETRPAVRTLRFHKKTVVCTFEDLVDDLTAELAHAGIRHVITYRYQSKKIYYLKSKLMANPALFHIDYSEKYACNFAVEPQSMHFGSSKQQATIHDEVMYVNVLCSPQVTELYFMSDGPTTQYRNRANFYFISSLPTPLYPQIQRVTWLFSGKDAPDGVGAMKFMKQ